MTLELAILLVGIALLGGVCITTIGPGGIFVTIALHQLLAPGPGTVAGTASVTFIATGLIGTVAYLRSGELRGPGPTRSAVILSLTSVAGALAGSGLNTFLDSGSFGAILGLFVLATGLLILWRERRGPRRPVTVAPNSGPTADLVAGPALDLTSRRGDVWMAVVGLAVGLPAGLLGVGGPVLAVPLLVMLGVPMLLAVGLAQVQSVLISLFASLGYAVQGVIDWSLALLVGIPLVVGTALGWWIAHRIRPARLKVGLAVVLVLLGLHLLLSGPPGG
ncbi:MAG: sulfite exporter TauE/SafE family protein [Gemmatimonadales bacterium]|nr:MAG: sulfite exporter TauE/SafE family protein [Gemmatimonadales bacterium]